jgi:ribosomal protein L37AE/L43A
MMVNCPRCGDTILCHNGRWICSRCGWSDRPAPLPDGYTNVPRCPRCDAEAVVGIIDDGPMWCCPKCRKAFADV